MRFFSFGLAILIVISLIGWLMYAPDRELETFKIKSPLKQLKEEQVNQVVSNYIGQSFWRLNIETIHADLVQIDWVYKAEVTRKWPSSLEIELVEQVPVVRWGNDALLNQNGEIFYPYDITNFLEYVVLHGEDIEAEKMLAKLVIFQQKFNQLGWVIERIDKMVDKGWKIFFVSKQQMIVGWDNWEYRVDRFILAYPKVKKEVRSNAQTYDLRYSNGFVIKILDK